MTNQDLANLIFPDVTGSIDDYEKKYPKRDLKEGEVVTRVAPSPTGYMHLGTLFQALIDYILVKNRGGVFYLRNEDTDTKREIEGAVKLVIDTLEEYKIMPDEYEMEGKIVGLYGPYRQTERKEIYHTFIKYLIEIGRAYPCFCTKEELAEMREKQEADKVFFYREVSFPSISEPVPNFHILLFKFRSIFKQKRDPAACRCLF